MINPKLSRMIEVQKKSLIELRGKLLDSPISFSARVCRAHGWIDGYAAGLDLEGEENAMAIHEFKVETEKLLFR